MSQANRPFNVLFVCTGNSCRSIMAEAILNKVGAGRFKAYSAGSMPTGKVNPHALALLEKLHYDTRGLRSKSWDEFSKASNPDAPDLDFVFTVCDNAAGEVCPYWPGQPVTAHWGMPDPALATGAEAEIGLAFHDSYRMLNNRLTLFVNLPMVSLGGMALQKRLEEIGALRNEPAREH